MAAGEGVSDGMSMREKAILKRRIHKQHNSNFKAGFIPINETYLHKTGLRGRKSYIVYGIVAILFVVALGNLLVTLTLLNVLRITYGMEGLEFIPNGRLVRFLVPSDFASVIPVDGTVGGFAKEDLHIYGSSGQEVELRADMMRPATLTLRPDAVVVNNVDSFRIVDPATGKLVFSTDYSDFSLPVSLKTLNVKKARLRRITSPIDKKLTLQADKQMILIGSEGVRMSAKEVVWSAGQDLILRSVKGGIRFNGTQGISFSLEKMPLVSNPPERSELQYKICVCKNNKRLFRVPVTANKYDCSNAVVSGSISPCL